MVLIDVLFGAVLLLAGRKLFWLAVGIIGFLAGAHMATHLLPGNDGLSVIAPALLFGVLGAMLAVAFEWLAVVVVVGFLGGGYFLANSLALGPPENSWIMFLVGGIIGMVLVILAFDWALIGISSLLGATLIVQHLQMGEPARLTIFVCSVVIGVLLQYYSTIEDEVKEE